MIGDVGDARVVQVATWGVVLKDAVEACESPCLVGIACDGTEMLEGGSVMRFG